MIHIWMENSLDKEANPSGLMSKALRNQQKSSKQVDVQQKPEAWSNKISSLPRPPGPVCLKLVTQDASRLHFRRSTYGWKANLIRKPIQVVSHQKLFRINKNRRNNSASRICQGATTPSFGPLDRVSCLDPLGARLGGDAQDSIISTRRSP